MNQGWNNPTHLWDALILMGGSAVLYRGLRRLWRRGRPPVVAPEASPAPTPSADHPWLVIAAEGYRTFYGGTLKQAMEATRKTPIDPARYPDDTAYATACVQYWLSGGRT